MRCSPVKVPKASRHRPFAARALQLADRVQMVCQQVVRGLAVAGWKRMVAAGEEAVQQGLVNHVDARVVQRVACAIVVVAAHQADGAGQNATGVRVMQEYSPPFFSAA